MKVGIFHPPINWCGGAEWVAIKIINCLKMAGHQTIVLTNEIIDQVKIKRVFGETVQADREIVFPLELFQTTDFHNVYLDAFRTLYLKAQCDILIDTQSNGLLPGVDVTYIHFPIFGHMRDGKTPKSKLTYYLPYHCYERTTSRKDKRLLFCNSNYTATATKNLVGGSPNVLYPPISKIFYSTNDNHNHKDNLVVSVSRISPEKRLALIPSIARLSNKGTKFLIIGLKQSEKEVNRLNSRIEKENVSDRVQLMTDVPRDQLLRILKNAKVFLHTAQGEHFGVSIAEAMASGCIPIVNNSGGPVEFVPSNLRFNGIADAAERIDRVIREWSVEYSESIIKIAHGFNETAFSRRFLAMLNVFLEKKRILRNS